MVLVWSLAFLGTAVLAAPPVSLEGEKVCPSPEATTRELERIVTVPEGSNPGDAALVVVEGAEIRVALVTGDGRLVGERRLPAEGTCDERARSVAVVLGSWLASEHPEYLGTLPSSSEGTTPSPDAQSAPLPPPIAPAKAPAPLPPAPPPAPSPRTAEPSDVGPRWRFRPGLAAGIELSDAGVVPAGELSLRLGTEGGSLGFAAFALFAGAEDRIVGSGSVSSFRWPLGAGVFGRLERGAFAFELEGGGMLGLLHLEGEHFQTNDTATAAQGGVYGALTIGAASGRLRPFATAKVLAWLGKTTASAKFPDAQLDLPVAEGVFVAGVLWGR